MSIIGILGGDSRETAALFLGICKEKGLAAQTNLLRITKNDVMPIVCIDENEIDLPRVWILQDVTAYNSFAIEQVKEDGYLIVNADSSIIPGSGCGDIITYGFNSKASITASSVADEVLQVCIQRGFKTMDHRFYEPQEFKTPCPSSVNPINVLGAVTACAVCDIQLTENSIF